MDFELNETQHLIQKTTRDYVERAVRPVAGELDRSERFPKEQLAGLAELGMMGVNIPAALGGAEAGAVSYALAMMEVARGCASTAVTMAVTNMVGEVITAFGSDEQKQRYVPKLTSGEYVAGSFALSEPEAGSDPGSMRTTARREGEHWVLDGQKQWISKPAAGASSIAAWSTAGGYVKDRHYRDARVSATSTPSSTNYPIVGHHLQLPALPLLVRDARAGRSASTSSPATTRSARSRATSAAGSMRPRRRRTTTSASARTTIWRCTPSYLVVRHSMFPLQAPHAGEPGYDPIVSRVRPPR
jgi:hypothetical protein